MQRFARLLAWALMVDKPRTETRVPRKSKEKRLEEKKRRGERKRERKTF